jgi:hypothetical protein
VGRKLVNGYTTGGLLTSAQLHWVDWLVLVYKVLSFFNFNFECLKHICGVSYI